MPDVDRLPAPPLPVGGPWLNCEDPAPWLDSLEGQVLVLGFWTYGCIHCLHMLPVLSRLEERFALAPVQVMSVHTPKFVQEQELEAVRHAVRRHHVQHPVLVDPRRQLRSDFAVKAWPTVVLVDSEGNLREHIQGETTLEDLSSRVEALLAEGRALSHLADEFFDPRREVSDDEHALFYPGKVEASDDRIFVADSGHHRVVIADHEGRVEKVVGSGMPGATDGRWDTASFRDPQGMALVGDHLYVADRANHLLRRVDLDLFWVETVAGTGSLGVQSERSDPDQPRQNALRSPWDLLGVGQHLVIAMAGSHQLWLYDTQVGQIGAWAGSGVEDHVDETLQKAAFAQPSGLCQVGSYLLVADSEVSSVRAVDLREGEVQTVVGHGLFDHGDVDGEGEDVLLQHCMDVAAIGETLYVADTYNSKIKAIDLRTRRCTTAYGLDRPEPLREPAGICAVGERLLVADTDHHRLLWIDPRDAGASELELDFSAVEA
jgi:thiol-disulfide isomerase/thioredoxin